MDKKPAIIMSALAEHSLARITAKPTAAKQQGASVADMLGKLHELCACLLHELDITDQPIAKRIAMAKDVAKLLPLLAKAERNVVKAVGRKDVEDMTDGELRKALKLVKASR